MALRVRQVALQTTVTCAAFAFKKKKNGQFTREKCKICVFLFPTQCMKQFQESKLCVNRFLYVAHLMLPLADVPLSQQDS